MPGGGLIVRRLQNEEKQDRPSDDSDEHRKLRSSKATGRKKKGDRNGKYDVPKNSVVGHQSYFSEKKLTFSSCDCAC